jgi:hypothetical protein
MTSGYVPAPKFLTDVKSEAPDNVKARILRQIKVLVSNPKVTQAVPNLIGLLAKINSELEKSVPECGFLNEWIKQIFFDQHSKELNMLKIFLTENLFQPFASDLKNIVSLLRIANKENAPPLKTDDVEISFDPTPALAPKTVPVIVKG